MKTVVTVSEVVNIISRTVKGTMAVSVDAVTVPDMRKTGNPYYGNIEKLCTMNGLIGFDYENSVNNQAAREGLEAREAKPRKWGILTADRLFVLHKGKTYLQMKVQSASVPIYRDNNGTIVGKDTLRPWLQEKSSVSSTQADLEKEVVVRDVTMQNLIGLRFNHAEYEIIPDGAEVAQETTATATAQAATVNA